MALFLTHTELFPSPPLGSADHNSILLATTCLPVYCLHCNIDEQVDTVTSYISFCVDSKIPVKTITIFPNNKPWVNKELKQVLNRKRRILFTGSEEEKEVNREVECTIKKGQA